MKIGLLMISLAAVTASYGATLRRLPETLVAEGETSILDGQNAVGMQTANSTIATVTPPDGNKSVLSGVRLGHTEITYTDERGPFAVRSVMVVPSYWEMLRTFFEDDPEVNLGIVGDKVVVSGQTANIDTLRRLDDAKKLDPSRLVVHVTYSATQLAELVKNFLENAGIKGVDVKVLGREVSLSGRLYDRVSIERADKRVREFLKDFPGVSVNSDGLGIVRQKILLDIEFVEWNDTRAKSLGMEPPKSIEVAGEFEHGWDLGRDYGQTFSSSRDSSTVSSHHVKEGGSDDIIGQLSQEPRSESDVGTDMSTSRNDGRTGTRKSGFATKANVQVRDVRVKINLAKENGVARSTYNTQLATQSGEEVQFQNGGTVYMTVQGGVGAAGDLRQFEYGYVVTAKPLIIDNDTLNLDFDVDCSQLNNKSGVNSSDYQVMRYKTKSKYTMRPGETIVLSGYDQVDEGSVKTGWPFLSYIPIINWFFGNRAQNTDKKEMLLVVTVNWGVEDSEGAKKRLEEIKSRKVDAEMP